MEPIPQIQLGKNGVTKNFLEDVLNHLKKHKNLKISVLKSAGHNSKKVKEYSEEIIKFLGKKYTCKIIGFTIVLKKWRKARE
jgi:RNA-binding protein YhbY